MLSFRAFHIFIFAAFLFSLHDISFSFTFHTPCPLHTPLFLSHAFASFSCAEIFSAISLPTG